MSKKILIIDDDPVIRRILRSRFQKEGFESFEACDGLDGLEQLPVINPDFIVLDVEMPRANGYSFMMGLKDHPRFRSVPVIVLTAHADKQPIFGLRGVRDYLIKPVDPEALIEKIRQILFPEDRIKSEKIIVIESHPTMRTLMAHFLKKDGYQDVVFCTTGEEGIQRTKEVNPDYAVIDTVLEDMTGYEACEKVCNSPGLKTRVIFIASAADQVDEQKISMTQTLGYAIKTPDFGNLLSILSKNHASKI